MPDKLLFGTARPLFRIGTNRWVLNQPCAFQDPKFPSEDIVNQSVLTGTLWEHRINIPRIFTFSWDKLDRPSCEILIDNILYADLDSTSIYLRPYFNFYKEYKVRCVNKWELDRMGKVNKPYKGSLAFEAMTGTTTKPEISSGSFDFNGTTKVEKSNLASNLTGNVSVEFWLRWSNGTDSIIFLTATSGPHWQIDNEGDQLSFITWTDTPALGHHLMTNTEFNEGEWYHIVCKRINTTNKYIYVNGVLDNNGNDTKAANNLQSLRAGYTSAGFDGLIQIIRAYDQDVDIPTYGQHLMIEAIPSSYLSNLEVWWDFSQGNADDLSENNNDGTVTGTEQYYEESFPDKGYEVLT